jgi:hypothetical protein
VFDPLNSNKRQPQLNEFALVSESPMGSMTFRQV